MNQSAPLSQKGRTCGNSARWAHGDQSVRAARGRAPFDVCTMDNNIAILGAEMGLFAIDTEFVGPGMPLWLPKGTVLVEELEKLAKETEFLAGYVRVKTPHLTKEDLFIRSGHLPYYA
mgnify:CR=1 FL=1